jgi:hypothetical protein
LDSIDLSALSKLNSILFESIYDLESCYLRWGWGGARWGADQIEMNSFYSSFSVFISIPKPGNTVKLVHACLPLYYGILCPKSIDGENSQYVKQPVAVVLVEL